MTRGTRILAISGGAVVLLLVAALITGVVMIQSGWLREKIREKVVEAAEKASGGKVEIGTLQLDWKTWTAEVDNLVIHGTEPVGAEPLLTAKRVVVGLKVISLIARDFNVASVEADDPRVDLIIAPDGSTNVPEPKMARSGKPVPETILGLKVGKFDLVNGVAAVERFGSNKAVTPWNARGANLNAHVTYNTAGPRYDGTISIAPLNFVWKNAGKTGIQIAAQVTATAAMEKNRLTLASATVKTAQSGVELSNVVIDNFTRPVTTGHYDAYVAVAEADEIFRLANFRHTGTINIAGDLRYVSATDYRITGDARGTGIGYGGVPNIRVSGKISAKPDDLIVSGLLVDAVGGQIHANAEIRKLEQIHLAGRLEHFEARSIAALGGIAKLPWDAIVSGPFELTDRLNESNLRGLLAGATLAIAPAGNSVPVHGEVMAKYNGMTATVELGRSWVELPHTRLDLAGTLGQRLDVKLQSTDLSDLAPVIDPNALPATLASQRGSITFDGTVAGALRDPRIAGHTAVQNAVWRGQPIDSLAADFTAMKTRATVTNGSIASNSLRARLTGSLDLTDWKPATTSGVTANVQLTNADAARLLALLGQQTVPVTGTLNTTAQISGTVGDPHATAELTLVKGQIYDEPYDSLTGHAQYLNSGAQLLTAVLDAGRKRINATLRFDQPDKLTFNVTSNAMAINQIALARKYQPALQGTAQLKADGVVRIELAHARPQVDILDLSADLRATGLALGTRSLGDAHLAATTSNGVMTASIDSNIAKSTIRGDGTIRLAGEYPVSAKLTFADVGLSAVAAAMRPQGNDPGSPDKDLNIDGSAAGEATVSGSAKTLDQLTASLNVTKLEVHPRNLTGEAKNIPNLSLRNNGPIHATLSKSVIRIDSARFLAPSTDLTLGGSVALNSAAPLDLRAQGNMNLAFAETYDSDLTSSGQIVMNATVRGSYANPDVTGRAELQKGDFHLANFSNGLTNANGVFLFSGTRATIQTLAAESGGGKVNVTGFAALAGGALTFRVDAMTRGVRVRYPEGVSSISDADLTLAGSSARSQASGTVTVRRVSINPKSDMSTILAGTAQPMKTPEGSAGFLSNMNLDVQIETAPDVAFETSVAQSIEADANLRLRGTASNPAVLGRINITQGELVFFGNKYTINQGSISFFNPAKIDPVLNVDLETKARGVDVSITVTGPLNGLNASYRSDPPLQYSDIVSLLATGRTPSDPTLAIRNTGQSQTLQQMGASQLITQAIANPVAGRLQRFFGVSKIKIDPQLTGITGSPEARLTIEQQISPELLFTYITDVSSTSTQLIRVEWNFNRRWSAILTREENGYVGIDFAFKKRFK